VGVRLDSLDSRPLSGLDRHSPRFILDPAAIPQFAALQH
jgi:hypothetical protein